MLHIGTEIKRDVYNCIVTDLTKVKIKLDLEKYYKDEISKKKCTICALHTFMCQNKDTLLFGIRGKEKQEGLLKRMSNPQLQTTSQSASKRISAKKSPLTSFCNPFR